MGLFTDLKSKLGAKKPTTPTQAAQPQTQPQPHAQKQGAKASPGAKPAPRLEGVKNVIAVASGKGGVGKSTSAVSLAVMLKEAGFSVGLLDADIYGPSLPTILGNVPVTMTEGKLDPPTIEGIRSLSVGQLNPDGKAAIMRGPMAGNLVNQMLTSTNWGDLDYLVIDYPPGTGDIQLSISQAVGLTGAIIVTTPQELAVVDVRKAVSMFKTLNVPVLGVVETMSYFPCECDGKVEKHFIFGQGGGETLAKENGLSLLAALPIDTRISSSCDDASFVSFLSEATPYRAAFKVATDKIAKKVEMLAANPAKGKDSFDLSWKN